VPDVVPLIKSQHREIEELLEQAQQEGSDPLTLLRRVAGLLGPHSAAEESFVYPRIAELQEDEAEEVHDGAAEHHHAESLLAELLAGRPDEPGYDGKLAALVGELRHHVEEEESELLPVLSAKASDQERERLGERFAAQTGRAEVRPDQVDSGSGSRASAGSSAGSGSGSTSGSNEPTKAELYEQAKRADIPGRSSMTKDELAKAISEKD
jgi:hemerythrin-like domain-containing protein